MIEKSVEYMENVQIIAEIGQAHEGSLGIAHSFIDALKDTGINTVKFQTHIAQAESSLQEPFRINFSYEDSNRYDYWKRMEFSEEQWKGLKQHCDEVGLEFLSSPFSLAAVDLLERVGVNKYKVGSGETANLLLLEKIARTGKETYLSTGLSDLNEVEDAIQVFVKYGTKISVLQCTTAYPTRPSEWGLNMIKVMADRFSIPVGFSDHSGDIYACLAAVTIGARIIEFHVTFDKLMFGPDSRASLTISQVRKLVEGIRHIEASLNSDYGKTIDHQTVDLRRIFGKSLAVNKTLKKGTVISFDDLETKKPKNSGIDASDFAQVVGRKLIVDKKQWDFLNKSDFQNE